MSSRIAVLPVALIAAALTLSAQTPAPPPSQDQRPVFRTEANFIRVDVFPTRNGVPVKNLTAADFEVLEDGVPQKLETFEHVQIRTGVPQEQRAEPNTVQEARDAFKNPRARVFVLFLDVPHVTVGGASYSGGPLVRMLDRILGEEDLVGVMTPKMAPSDIVFARKTQVLKGGLRHAWPWGERHTLKQDEIEALYEACFPWAQTKEVVQEMQARKRERTTLEAMHDLVKWLRDEREERKAVVTVSEGWHLYRPNSDLTRLRIIGRLPDGRPIYEPMPGPEPIGVGPDGQLRIGHSDNIVPGTSSDCWAARHSLSHIDNDAFFRDITDEANRANASFYTVDPRGLPVFDTPMGPAPPLHPSVDLAQLRHRIATLRTLAENTDGLAVVNSNDIEKGLRRMADDLTSYYLLGYYSTNTKLDGRFRRIQVRVKQPGIDLRARRGYKAATEREMTESRRAAPAPVPEHVARAHTALASLGRIRPSSPFRAHAVAVQGDVTTVWVAGELKSPAAEAGKAEITVSAGGGTSSAAAALVAGQRGFVVPIPLKVRTGEPLDIRVRVGQEPGQPPLTDMMKVDAVEGLAHPLMYRRGPSTGNRVQPVGEPVFSRTERARFEIPASADTSLTAGRLLDRNGAPIELPVTVAERTDESGQRWLTAEVILAPLAPGDYVVELSGTAGGQTQKVLAAIRVTR